MYQSEIVGIGILALDFLQENLLILFGKNAPMELAEISVLHQHFALEGTIEAGDRLCIGENSYTICQVGEEVNHTFASMGHCTLRFGKDEGPTLPGTVVLKETNLPIIEIGMQIQIEKGQKEA